MVKKIVLGTLLVGLIAVLVAGGIIRTLDKTENMAEAQGQGHGQRGAAEGDEVSGTGARGQGYGRSRNADASSLTYGDYGQDTSNVERQYPNFEPPLGEQVAYQGIVVQAPSAGVDLVVKTDDGAEVVVGTGPGYMEAQGFNLVAGDRVQVVGYWEDEELKAAQVMRLADGLTITLRDDFGRPAWSSSSQRAAQQALAGQGGRGQGGYGGQGRTDVPGDGTATGQAQVDDWLEVRGVVTSATSDALVVRVAGGDEIAIDGRSWRFVQEQGFQVQAGDSLTLTGFYEEEDLEIGRIHNASSGQIIQIREESGRPLWAGGGGRGS